MQTLRHIALLSLALTLFVPESWAQTRITLDVQQSFGPHAWLYAYNGKELFLVDSCQLGPGGQYVFNLPADAPQGQYRLTVGRTGIVELLVYREPHIALRSVVYAMADSLRILQSDENRIFVRYMHVRHEHERRQKLLEELLRLYPTDSPFAHTLQQELSAAQERFFQATQPLAAERRELLVASYINLDAPPYARWDGVDLNLPALLNTPIWPGALWRTVEHLQSDLLDKEQQDDRYTQLVASLLDRPMADTMRYMLVGQLHSMFGESDYYTTIETLLRLGQSHTNTMADIAGLKQRIAQERPLAIGAKATDFSFRTLDDQKLKLSQTGGRYRLLLFWSAWCPHCVEMLPELRQLYDRYHPKGLEIVAVSVDVDDAQLPAFVRGNQLPWPNTALTPQNEDRLAKTYNIDGTPKMLLIDDKMRIVSKPLNPTQLHVKLKQIFGE